MLTYSVAMNYTTLFADPFPKGYPSWLLNGQCGHGTAYACSAPDGRSRCRATRPIPRAGDAN